MLHSLDDRLAPDGRVLLDVGFIGTYAEASVHYAVVDAMRASDRLIGIDVDAERLAGFLAAEETKARRAKHALRYETMSILETRFADAEIDVVLLLEVFEHLFTPYCVFDEIARILKPGGVLVMTYPNPLNLSLLLRFLLRDNLLDAQFRRMFRGAPDHRIFPHPVCLANYLDDRGFEVGRLAFIKYAYKRLGVLNKLLMRLVVTRKLSSYVGVYAVKR